MNSQPDTMESTKLADRRSIWERIPRWLSLSGFLIAVLVLWQLLANSGWVSPFILPTPASVFDALLSFCISVIEGGALRQALLITVVEALLAFVLAVILGVGFGFIVAESSFGRIVLLPILVA